MGRGGPAEEMEPRTASRRINDFEGVSKGAGLTIQSDASAFSIDA